MADIKVGNKIREIRLFKNKSRYEVAEKAGIDIETLARYERNEREPVVSTLVAIAEKGLECTVDELLNPNPTLTPAGSAAGQGRKTV